MPIQPGDSIVMERDKLGIPIKKYGLSLVHGWMGNERVDVIKAIMEHHEYMWDAKKQIDFGTYCGAQRALDNSTYLLGTWGYLSLFNQ